MKGSTLTVTYELAVKPKARPRTGRNPKTGKPMIYPEKETKAAEEALQFCFKAAMQRQGFQRVPKRYPVRARLWFVYHDPKLPKGAMAYKKSKPDMDNMEKTIFDAMNKIVFEDDGQVAACDSRKVMQNSSLGDCCIIEITVLNDEPVIQAFNI